MSPKLVDWLQPADMPVEEMARGAEAVEQVDRDAAADLMAGRVTLAIERGLRAGRDDDHCYVKAFARHRTSAHQHGLRQGIEAGARPISSAELIALLDDPDIAAAVNEKGGGRWS